MVCKDGKWPDHAKFFYELLAADFAYTVEKPTSKLKASYFSLVSAALKKKPPPDPFSDEACTSVAAATAECAAECGHQLATTLVVRINAKSEKAVLIAIAP